MKLVFPILVIFTLVIPLAAESIISVTRQSTINGQLRAFSLTPDDILRDKYGTSDYGYFGVKNSCSVQKSGTFAREFGSLLLNDLNMADSIHRRSPDEIGKTFVQFKTDGGKTYTVWDSGPKTATALSRVGIVMDSLLLAVKSRYTEEPEITNQPDTIAMSQGVFPYLCFPIWGNAILLESDQQLIPYIAAYLKNNQWRKVAVIGSLSESKKKAPAMKKHAEQLAKTVKNHLVQSGVDSSKLFTTGIVETFRGASAVLPGYVKIVVEKQ